MMKVLITGASSGIGKQLALDYASKGYDVFACARSENKLESLKNTYPDCMHPVVVDVTRKEDIQEAFQRITDIDLVILNAGTCEYVDINDFNSSLFERVYAVNFFGVIYCVESLLPKLKSNGSKLVVVGSMSKWLPFTRAQAYGSSKAAIEYFTNSLAVDLDGSGVSVHLVSPGFVKTELTDKNDFSMPFLMSVENASQRIIRGLKSNKKYIAFPKRLVIIFYMLSILPVCIQKWLCIKMKRDL